MHPIRSTICHWNSSGLHFGIKQIVPLSLLHHNQVRLILLKILMNSKRKELTSLPFTLQFDQIINNKKLENIQLILSIFTHKKQTNFQITLIALDLNVFRRISFVSFKCFKLGSLNRMNFCFVVFLFLLNATTATRRE